MLPINKMSETEAVCFKFNASTCPRLKTNFDSSQRFENSNSVCMQQFAIFYYYLCSLARLVIDMGMRGCIALALVSAELASVATPFVLSSPGWLN